MEIKVVDNKKKKNKGNKVNYFLIFFLTVFLTALILGLAIKLINAAVNGPEGITSTFMLGINGKMTLTAEFWSKGLPSQVDYIANILLLIVTPISFFIWGVLSIASIYSIKNEIIISEEKHEMVQPVIHVTCPNGCSDGEHVTKDAHQEVAMSEKVMMMKDESKTVTEEVIMKKEVMVEELLLKEESKPVVEEVSNIVQKSTINKTEVTNEDMIKAEEMSKALAVKYAKELKTKSPVEKDGKKLSAKERAALDGSSSIIESRSELQKHANSMRSVAEERNIKLKDSNLRDMTKKELVQFMYYVSEQVAKTPMPIKKKIDRPVDATKNIQILSSTIPMVKTMKKKYPQVSKKMILEEIFKENPDLTKKEITQIVNKIFVVIKEHLAKLEEINLYGFGKISVIEKLKRESRNPMTGETINIPASSTTRFKPAKALKEQMNK